MWALVLAFTLGAADALPWNVVGVTRVVSTGQGPVRGVTVAPSQHPGLRKVELFLGIPYAAPPVGSLRFMPPGTPSPWNRIRIADSLPPVCPQNLPNLEEEGRRMAPGRMAYLKRLLPYLKNQSEDCLHLNIYAPAQEFPLGPSRFPVMVFIHGESFHWNSGNPYDGSILASYADVIVVTINYRLGILGFLRPGMDAHTISNFGLFDQIAALQWVKENIARFGGDPSSVTIVGHHTGAVAVNYLMLSPVVQAYSGLFQRAILMSGSSLSEWASAAQPEQASLQVAEALNCPRHGDLLVACLRKKRVSDLLAVRLPRPLGPIVDGHVVPNHPRDLMANYTDLFTKYDLMCGVTEAESYHMLDAESLARGLLVAKRDELLKEYFRETFPIYPETAQAEATLFYTEKERGRSAGENSREATVALLSDSRVVAPILQTALYHSKPPSSVKTYMYVFAHKSKYSDYHYAERSVYGEELPYILGVPLDGPRFHYTYNYNLPEKLLSEVVMTLWTNFAKSGNPNTPRKYNYFTMTKREWLQYDIVWPEFEPQHQMYYNIDAPPKVGFKYRSEFLKFWNEDLPLYLMSPTRLDTSRFPSNHDVPEDANSYREPTDMWMRPRRPTSKPSWGVIRHFPNSKDGGYFPSVREPEQEKPAEPDHIASASSFALSVVIVVGICFLLVNLGLFSFVCYQKRRVSNRIDFTARYRCSSSPSLPEFEKEPRKDEVRSILKSAGGSFEALKSKERKWPGMYRQASSSTMTMDPHTKVSEWITQDAVNKSVPDLLSSREKIKDKDSDKGSTATTSRLHGRKVKKVSVAVDATPSARSASVLKQTPIELTKSLDSLSKRKERPALHKLQAFDDRSDETLDAPPPSPEADSKPEDVNVTSRERVETRPRTPEEALDNIKRRNFPKVLPDFPEADPDGERPRDKRMSLPFPGLHKKVPPPPPPRISTLSRRGGNRNTVPNFMLNYADAPGKPRRAEPRVVIKPTLADPNQKKDNPQIPRVTHHHSVETSDKRESPPTPAAKDPPRPPGGVGAPVKIQPVKKTTPTEPLPELTPSPSQAQS